MVGINPFAKREGVVPRKLSGFERLPKNRRDIYKKLGGYFGLSPQNRRIRFMGDKALAAAPGMYRETRQQIRKVTRY